MRATVLPLLPWLLMIGATEGLTNTRRYTTIDGLGMYRLASSPVTTNAWHEAHEDCLKDGGHLAIINSRKEADALRTFVASSGTSFIYIGFSDLYDEGRYVTVHGTPLDRLGYSRWLNGVPNNSSTTNCGAVTPDMELSDQACNIRYDYICEMPIRSNYEYVKDVGYYKFYTDGMTWQEASRICAGDGAHLLVVESAEEIMVVREMFEKHPLLPNTDDPDFIHYGVHDYYKDVFHVNMEGGPFVPVLNIGPQWAYYEPKASATMNVVRLSRDELLSVAGGTEEYAFICEHETYPKFY